MADAPDVQNYDPNAPTSIPPTDSQSVTVNAGPQPDAPQVQNSDPTAPTQVSQAPDYDQSQQLKPPAQPAAPQQPFWKTILQGALNGLAGSAGARNWGQALGMGVRGDQQQQQEQFQNKLQQQQVQNQTNEGQSLIQFRNAQSAHYAAQAANDAARLKLETQADNDAHEAHIADMAAKMQQFDPSLTYKVAYGQQGVMDHASAAMANGGVDLPTKPMVAGNYTLIPVHDPNAPLQQQLDTVNSATQAMGYGKITLAQFQKNPEDNLKTARNYAQGLDVTDNDLRGAIASTTAQRADYAKQPNADPKVLHVFDTRLAGLGYRQEGIVAKQNSDDAREIYKHNAEERASQAIKDGDPVAAGHLLATGVVSPSQIVSARNPAFAQQAFSAAEKESGGKWNAQTAEGQYTAAKSPTNVTFFGSAKALTDKGGSLDQLLAAGNDVPAGQYPALNTIADWQKVAAGSGPMQKYAAKALGVSDDAAKVMGGGVGSDAGQLRVLNLFKANLSPEGRQAAVEGMRGIINSQIDSRIGTNPVLQHMYGDGLNRTAPSGAQPMYANAPGKPRLMSVDGGKSWTPAP